jgi:hypothetical protein
MSSGNTDIFTGLPLELSKGQKAKADKAAKDKKPAETTQQSKTDDKKPTVSIALTIEEEEDVEDIPDEEEAERLSKRLAAFERKKAKKIEQEKLDKAAKFQKDMEKAADEIAKLKEDRENATQEILLIRGKIDLIDGKIASFYAQFPDLDPTQANNDSEDEDVSVGGADIRPTPTAKTASPLDEKWQVVGSFAGKTAVFIPSKETGKQVASSGPVKILEIKETETETETKKEKEELSQLYHDLFPNGAKPCVNAYVYWFLELLRAFECFKFNPAKGCQKTPEECALCKNHNLKGFLKNVAVGTDKFSKCLDLFDGLLNSSFKFYGVNTTVEQYNFYQELVNSFRK